MHSLFIAILAVSLLSGASAGITASKVTVQVSPDNIVSDTDTYNLETVVCLQPALSFFCNLIHVAQADPKVALLYDPNTVATVFAPTNRGINNTRWQILRWTGATLETLSTTPSLASKFVRSNLMLGSAPDYRSWRNGTAFYNELVPAQVLTVIEGTGRHVPPGSRRDLFIRGPLNTARAGFQGMYNLIGGKGFVNVIEVPIIPAVLPQ